MQGWLSILIMIALGAGFGLISVLLSSVLGPRHPTPEKSAPYECGMPPVGDARERQSVKFYLVAMSFIVLDVEIVFLYPFAVVFRGLGLVGEIKAELVKALAHDRHVSLPDLVGVDAAAMTAEKWPR